MRKIPEADDAFSYACRLRQNEVEVCLEIWKGNGFGLNWHVPKSIDGGYNAEPLRICKGHTVLSMAFMVGASTETLRVLLKSGANPNQRHKTEAGETPMHLIVRYGTKEQVKLFMSYGGRLDIRDRARRTPIQYLMTDFDDFFVRNGHEYSLKKQRAVAIWIAGSPRVRKLRKARR